MRREFSAKVKVQAFDLCKGHCEECGKRLYVGDIRYDHRIPDALGGEPVLSNCQVLCVACHGLKTAQEDVPTIAKNKRIRRREAGIRKPRTILSWRRFNGDPVHKGRDRT